MSAFELSTTTEIIRLEHIEKRYGDGELEVLVLQNVNLTIYKGEYCAIMGPSGSGKSTTMHIIGCLDRPSRGYYYLAGEAISQINDDELAYIRNRKIGFVFQQFHLLPQLSALENVMLPMTYAGISRNERRERSAFALSRVGLEQRMHNRPNQLSGGQQQRVAIARAIVNQPILLLADEPTGALDSRTSREILEIFQNLNDEGMTIVMVTHDPSIARLCQRIIWFQDGKITDANRTLTEFEEWRSPHYL
ncbi:macrolide ABC transporter ATP-binding protein [Scytonema hofmannii PCC 7110]|uniref:Macrolide ABC transporter ATP-binding protein n=1 Tax=Scytonema hofmannii PCC 7110 TaxID=128403 RepID=A0A139WZX0_9CYAN|nr:ABC transporter ATP-binding protein [Scytonema hofmannii]KYC37956.1 macrolide ABC transporter ATP-binding protein [Scytonema hofmannii PCC 7110]